MAREENIARPIGYAALIQRYRLELPRPRHLSSVGPGVRKWEVTPAGIHESFPEQFERDTKRGKFFSDLEDAEGAGLEDAIREAFQGT